MRQGSSWSWAWPTGLQEHKGITSTVFNLTLLPVKVRGFETQMEKWMGACDCIITKVCTVTMSMQSVSLSISSDLLKKGFYAVQCVSHIEAAWNLAYSIGNSMFSSDYDPKSQHFHGE
ncbi:hypothetical protein U9M48_036725 [Paspalum notatum var. saurae]|uniref:Uncharacterized protein n=1 Tax=Paspalum notatum var. saurae TaxID=547442 RepID=A0AAQ3UE23_PASNO